jgi:hypothetical protein
MAMKVGKRFIPYQPVLFGLAAAILVFTLVWMKVPPIGKAMNGTMGWFGSMGTPFYLIWFDKTFLTLPRLLHALALFYVLGHLPIMRTIAQSWIAAPFRLMGRQGLAVFAAGTVLSMALQVVKAPMDAHPLWDGLLLGGGLLFLVGLAWVLTKTAELSRAKAA